MSQKPATHRNNRRAREAVSAPEQSTNSGVRTSPMENDSQAHAAAQGEPEPARYEIGYGRPPVHSRFRPGASGNPSGRPKGSQNLSTLFNKILKEQVSLREGPQVRKVSKAEAILRGLVVGAMKGDQRSVVTLFRLAEQTGQFEEVRGGSELKIIISGVDAELL